METIRFGMEVIGWTVSIAVVFMVGIGILEEIKDWLMMRWIRKSGMVKWPEEPKD